MRSRGQLLVCLAAGLLLLLVAGPALAQGGTSTSAGDQQYVDPLASTNSTPATSPTPSAPAASSSSASSGSTASTSPSQAAAAGPSSGAAHTDPGGTLPYTGLNLGLLVAIGAGLLVAGLVLRRVLRRT